MPQGSLLGPISFVIHIDDLQQPCDILKHADDITLSEIVGSNSSVSNMQTLLDQLLTSSDQNNMQINSSTAKETILGSAGSIAQPQLLCPN